MPPTVARPEIDALVRGEHRDPLAILGPHDTAGGLAIRVFRPHVRGVELVSGPGRQPRPLERVHGDGWYEIVVAGATRGDFDYRLRVLWPDGSASEIDDPYRYGP